MLKLIREAQNRSRRRMLRMSNMKGVEMANIFLEQPSRFEATSARLHES